MIKLPAIFGDHMVAQQDTPLPVWGKAEAGKAITVTLAGKTATATADTQGKWKVTLPPIKEPGPHTMVITAGQEKIEVNDVLAGEVWLNSGQSNMELPLSQSRDAEQEAAAADWPAIRLFLVARAFSDTPLDDVPGRWMLCTPETVKAFSAVAYFFGRALHQKLGQNIGLIATSVGGSAIDAWLPKDVIARLPKHTHERTDERHTDASIHNAMLAGLMPFAVRGFTWYQGESNAGMDAALYEAQLTSLIETWRAEFAGPRPQPFLVVQLANYEARHANAADDSGWAIVRERQRRVCLNTPGCGLAVIADIGDADDIHPINKQDVGHRLALLALRDTYHQDVQAQGPVPLSATRDGDDVLITFKFGPLQLSADTRHAFAVGGDGDWTWARDVAVEGDNSLRLQGAGRVKAVRYAWQVNPPTPLRNSIGLPATPFELSVG